SGQHQRPRPRLLDRRGLRHRGYQRETLVPPGPDHDAVAHEGHDPPRAQLCRHLVSQRHDVELFGRPGNPHAGPESLASADFRFRVERKADLQRLTPALLVEGEHGENEIAHDDVLVVGLRDHEIEMIPDGTFGNDSHDVSTPTTPTRSASHPYSTTPAAS